MRILCRETQSRAIDFCISPEGAVRTSDGRAIAEFTGYSRTLGGPVID
jgi:hypothetical protein